MKLTIASLVAYVTLALVTHQPETQVVGHILDLPPDFLHDASSNLLEMEAIAAMGKGRHSTGAGGDLDANRKGHHCSVEMKMRIPGKCKYMGRAGVACVAGEYMDLVNEECMM